MIFQRTARNSFSFSMLYVIVRGGSCEIPSAGSYAEDILQTRRFRKGRKCGRGWGGGKSPFVLFREFPATYVYSFRDRFASREIGLSTYCNSPPALSRRRTRTRAQDTVLLPIMFSTKFAKHRARKNRIFATKIEFRGFLCRTITFFTFYIDFFLSRKRTSLIFRCEYIINLILFIIYHDEIDFCD